MTRQCWNKFKRNNKGIIEDPDDQEENLYEKTTAKFSRARELYALTSQRHEEYQQKETQLKSTQIEWLKNRKSLNTEISNSW